MKTTGEKIVVGALSGKPSRLKQASPDSEIYKRGWTVGFFKPSKESTKSTESLQKEQTPKDTTQDSKKD